MADTPPKLTPMMERYLEVKRNNPGAVLLFRMGDFYELFYEDAELAAKILGLTLTSRDKGVENPVPMAGFPYHALEGYLQKLIRAGCRVSVCEQVEDPKKAKGMVKREVTRIVTPGTLTEETLLDPRENNFLAALCPAKDRVGLAWLELSAGRFYTADLDPEHLPDELARIRPAECLVPEGHDLNRSAPAGITLDGMMLSERPPWAFAPEECRRSLLEHFGTSTLEGFGLDGDSPGITAAGALLDYVHETQKSALGHITKLEPYRRGTTLIIDESTRRSLELTRTIREGKRAGSLLDAIDETVTPMGARLLADWLSNPLTDGEAITRRLDAVEELTRDALLCRELREQLDRAYDLGRLTGRIATGRATPRDLSCLARTLALLPRLKAKLAGRNATLLQQLEADLDLCPELRSDVEAALVDEPPIQTTEGGIIRDGYHAELDELRDLSRGGKEWIARYQAEEIERTGIPNLKIGFNKVFGYYLEVTAAHADKVPEDYIRKQTLKNQERYITPDLKEHEDKVLRAEEQAIQLEQDLFQSLRDRTAKEVPRLQQTASVLARLDVLAALAVLAVNNNYVRPEVTDEPVLEIREGRHPVLDKLQPTGEFVPNDILLGSGGRSQEAGGSKQEAGDRIQDSAVRSQQKEKAHGSHPVGSHDQTTTPPDDPDKTTTDYGQRTKDKSHIQILTGPNMSGKSTYIRQGALLTILAQMGSFVPASRARIGIADRIFARVGASDELQRGQSTFMVEMTETARILNTATENSLVILDEIGRGTSTYDGISLAWAVTEHLHDVVGCRTLFATHYHELTELPQTLPHAANWNVAVREEAGEVIFLHKIVPGAADRSYGIHVARLAGVPPAVIDRARIILDTLESDHLDETGRLRLPERPTSRSQQQQLSLFEADRHPLLEELRELDVDQMTPLAALEKLHRMRETLNERGRSNR